MLIEIDNSIFLSPISADSICGIEIEYQPEYIALKKLRVQQPDDLPDGVWKRNITKVNWKEVVDKSSEILINQCKDLQVAAWRVEALLQLYGPAGYLSGVQLLLLLLESYWDPVYPLLEDDDSSARSKPIRWLLAETIKWFNSFFLPNFSEDADIKAWFSLIESIRNQLLYLKKFLDERLLNSSPSFHEVIELFNNQLLSIQSQSLTKSEDITTLLIQQADSKNSFSRDSLYSEIASIATKLSTVEPHSPVPFILREISQWKSSSFEDILKKLPKEGNSVYDLYKLFSRK